MSPVVEMRLAEELSDQGIIFLDPRITLMSPVCGLASHSLARYLTARRGYELTVKSGLSSAMTSVDRGFPYKHTLIFDDIRQTVIDPTPLQALSFTGYHMDYILQYFSTPPEQLVGPVRIAEFSQSSDGTAGFVDTMLQAVRRVAREARPIRKKLDMIGGQPFLDMSDDEIRMCLADIWNLSNYLPYPEANTYHDYKVRIAHIADVLLRIADEKPNGVK